MTGRYLVSGSPLRGTIITFAGGDRGAPALHGLCERFEDQWRVIVCERLLDRPAPRGAAPWDAGDRLAEDGPEQAGRSEDAAPSDEDAACRFVMERLLDAPVGAAVLYGIGEGAGLARAVAREMPQCVLALIIDEAPAGAGGAGAGPREEHSSGLPLLAGPAALDLDAVEAFLDDSCPALPFARPYYEPEQERVALADPLSGRREYRESRAHTAEVFTAPRMPEGIAVRVEDFDGVECRVMGYEDRAPGLLVLIVHGGGYMLGEARYEDPRNIDIVEDFTRSLCADGLGAITISPEYRLAPEHPFPAGRDDVVAVLRETVRRYPGVPLFVAGDSAGAGLVNQALHALDDSEYASISGAIALEPCLNPLMASASSYDFWDGPVWPRNTGLIAWDHYQGGRSIPWRVCPPMGTSRRPFPPVYVAVNTADLLRDEGVAWAFDLVRAGVAVDLHSFAGTVHGWSTVPPTGVWERMKDTIRSFIRTCLADAPSDGEDADPR